MIARSDERAVERCQLRAVATQQPRAAPRVAPLRDVVFVNAVEPETDVLLDRAPRFEFELRAEIRAAIESERTKSLCKRVGDERHHHIAGNGKAARVPARCEPVEKRDIRSAETRENPVLLLGDRVDRCEHDAAFFRYRLGVDGSDHLVEQHLAALKLVEEAGVAQEPQRRGRVRPAAVRFVLIILHLGANDLLEYGACDSEL